ncbi:GNAT family N-acetyltransferase [Paracoccus sp. Z118]|uniref:GNAT family N-acetyltransferase n=1 Tax=Paracoccus sp. Z118 TaxID=2851017 RepID=UPI001C2C641B|nr:GNAT family N-acetyltransferase [Paracoccus sp. Z118]MBV0893219.1 GNAT family N-acetyltransferase [Paracoccus sp. Z118]
MSIGIRPAREQDAPAILALVRSERMRPTGLDWRRFHLAVETGAIIGAVQLRPKGPELASLVVRADRRCRGIGAALILSRLAGVTAPVFLVAPRELSGFYRRRGFAPCQPSAAPCPVAIDWALGQSLGTFLSLAKRSRPRRMIVMVRARAASPAPRAPLP